MPSSQRRKKAANDFGWWLYECEPNEYSWDELWYKWDEFCTYHGLPNGGFTSIVYTLKLWRVLKQTGWPSYECKILRPVQSNNWKNPTPGALEGSLEGQRPASLLSFGRALDSSPLPPEFARLKLCDIRAMRMQVARLLEEKGLHVLKQPGTHLGRLELTSDDFAEWPHMFRNLLRAEELQMSFDIGVYDMNVKDPLNKTAGVNVSRMFSLDVPGVAEKRPSVLRGDAVLVIAKTGRFKAYVHRVLLDRVDLSFHADFDNRPPFTVKFFFSRTPLKLMHRALEDTSARIPYIYSRRQAPDGQPTRPVPALTTSQDLNAEQRHFVVEAVRARSVVDITMDDDAQALFVALSAGTTDARERRLAKAGSTILYHQTDPEAAKKILDCGRMFRGAQGALGGGIYFAKTPEDTERKALKKGGILVCSVRLGRIKMLSELDTNITFTQLQRQKFDSVYFGGFTSGPEYVVYNFDQVTPLHIYQGRKKKTMDPAPLPLVLWGPPGTGKTTTLVAAMFEVVTNLRGAKILATAPSNAAADLLCERLAKRGIGHDRMLRLNGILRSDQDVPANVKPYTRRGSSWDTHEIPELTELQSYDIIVCTCASAGYLASRASLPGWITHLFVDEAAQGLEPEVLIPVSVLEPGGLLVLAGDFKQLGPIIRSPEAARLGLDMSLLERVVQHIGVDHRRVHTLLKSYRAHPSILGMYNHTMYGGMLQSYCPRSSYDMVNWECCPLGVDGHPKPVVFHHIQGEEARDKMSPSWSNPDEVEVLRAYIKRLKDFHVQADDVGIITPYQLQCKRLGLMCRTEQFPATVGTTEQFQGRERRIILLSTVRSRRESEIPQDMKFAIGFVGNEKRTNVALSRACSALVVVGNLKLLSADPHWHEVIKIAKREGYCCGDVFALQPPQASSPPSRGAMGFAVDQEVVSRPWQRLE
eukprot:TRINITY_DN47309_c0_g1_i1.p1 TRINITY_DN47309_c0_g1~~TRINITY_DN47309_c0_g1_i1.p1  ORF type:complete len:928 (+),score=93.15 TRINITY_DN47309_c0_g1_i1:69-2852(+)